MNDDFLEIDSTVTRKLLYMFQHEKINHDEFVKISRGLSDVFNYLYEKENDIVAVSKTKV